MAVHKLFEDEISEHSYSLIAVHSSMEDYRLAYFLNSRAATRLKRLKQDLMLENDVGFPIFEWIDEASDICWNLLRNKVRIAHETKQTDDMFGEGTAYRSHYLIPEKQQVDYFVKIDNEGPYAQTERLIRTIKDIPQVITAYQLDPGDLKSKNNLIFLVNAK
ncbi:IPExxxVDY family protein [Robertkochia aurantiaca]|uniref:IPExxxVDY family protein n=1 Tax=Robertkochia aurantiaca TaxID=2873700 RepID=UPI001CCB2209|nr:IPExxxVDY family protein [Robertkochia sp. 3YJGBD-33]